MRRREKSQPVPSTGPDAEPPEELWRFVPSQPAPIGPHGRPEPWAVQWRPEEFAAFLRARAAWRDTHTRPLYGLPSLERIALHNMAAQLPRGLVEAERTAVRRAPSAPYRPIAAPVIYRPNETSQLEEDPTS
ncbi:MAG: hypothetical protein JWP40_2428 [Blastococcus sp.]|nr:hypothetical protein [Blastococcus sp.]